MGNKILGSEFTMNDPSEYTLAGRMVAPDGFVHNVIYHKEKDEHGYIVKPRSSEDKSFYAPYILNKIGQKIGVKTPETALGLFIMLEDEELTYRDSFFDSSCVFVDNSSRYDSLSNISSISPEVVYEIFSVLNPGQAEKHRQQCSVNGTRAFPLTIDEHIDSTIFMLSSRGSKPQSEYTTDEINQMRQDIIDRIVLGLKLGIKGETQIVTYDDKYARLSSYYLASHNMFGLNLRKEWIDKQILKSDEEFLKIMNSEFPVQYGINHDTQKPTSQEVLKYLFDKYPVETERAYNKVKRYTVHDLDEELSSFTLLDESHRRFALRVFGERDREFSQVYKEHSKNQNIER